MLVITEDALLMCEHPNGVVSLSPHQSFVTIAGRRVLVEADPEKRSISGCGNAAPPMRPCLTTLAVKEGYSELVRIDGHRVCLDSVSGLTDGMPPGVVRYTVHRPGHKFVSAGT
jgi:hypothetical protein